MKGFGGFGGIDGIEGCAARLRARLAAPLPGVDAHRRMMPTPPRAKWTPGAIPDTARPAAALALLYPIDGRLVVPLTVRRRDLPHHPGQISLPGGRVDAGESLEAAALREAREEIGLDPHAVHVAGSLSPFFVFVSNFVIHPFVAIAGRRPAFHIEAREVEALIEVPLADLADSSRIKWGTRTREGYLVDYPYIELDGRQLWGATAMILSELVAVLGEDA